MLRLISELLPIGVFFVSYKLKGIIFATFTTLLISIIHIVISYFFIKKITIIQIIYSISLLLFGSITLLTGNASFIKMKPTVFYLIISITLFVSNKIERPILKKIFHEIIAFSNKSHWSILSNRASIFYMLLAITNEIIWRNFSEIAWVRFKVFFALPMIAFFMLVQIPYVLRHNIKRTKK